MTPLARSKRVAILAVVIVAAFSLSFLVGWLLTGTGDEQPAGSAGKAEQLELGQPSLGSAPGSGSLPDLRRTERPASGSGSAAGVPATGGTPSTGPDAGSGAGTTAPPASGSGSSPTAPQQPPARQPPAGGPKGGGDPCARGCEEGGGTE